VGATRAEQVVENLKAVDVQLPREAIAKLDEWTAVKPA
jgi:aryl-alcohol dehydrogenase-like predicted oxidoreductase